MNFIFRQFFRQRWPHMGKRIEGKVRIDRFRAIARQHRKVVNFTRFAALDHQSHFGAQTRAGQVEVDCRSG